MQLTLVGQHDSLYGCCASHIMSQDALMLFTTRVAKSCPVAHKQCPAGRMTVFFLQDMGACHYAR